jgi:hypothetical protein
MHATSIPQFLSTATVQMDADSFSLSKQKIFRFVMRVTLPMDAFVIIYRSPKAIAFM